MQKNLLMAVVLSAIIYLVWFTWIYPPEKMNIPQAGKQTVEKTEKRPAEKIISEKPEKIKIQKIAAKNNEKYEFKTEKSIYVINGTGAFSDIIYHSPIDSPDLILDKKYPFFDFLNELNYSVKEKKDNLLTLAATLKDVKIEKTINLSPKNEINTYTLKIKNLSNQTIVFPSLEIPVGPGIGTVKSELKENNEMNKAIYAYYKHGRKNPAIEELEYDYNKTDWIWAAVNNRYFIFSVLNNENFFKSIKYQKTQISDKDYPMISFVTKEIEIAPRETKTFDIKFYVGPKDYSHLKKIGYGLHLSIDFGFFAPIAKIFNSLLRSLYTYTHNYGVAIIILSVLIQIVIFPLSMKSYKAMAIMKKMQPEMKSIQERYKKDPQRMNMELMQLYKKYGANPFSGCWPMLLQIPIFFALFTMLRNSWDLHGAHFVLWIKDLSDKDPYYVLPIIMGGLMFIQNNINPQTMGDKTQAAVMKWMPVIFTFLFMNFPSGLVLYWIINSIFSIGQNYYLKVKGVI